MKYKIGIMIGLSLGYLYGAETKESMQLPQVVMFPLLNSLQPKPFTWEDVSYSELYDSSTGSMREKVLQLLEEQRPPRAQSNSPEYWSSVLLNHMADQCNSYKIEKKQSHKTFPLEHSYHLLLAFLAKAKKEYSCREDIKKDAKVFLHTPLKEDGDVNPQVEATIQHRLQEFTYEIKTRKVWVVPSAEATYLILLQDLSKYMKQAKDDETFSSARFFSPKHDSPSWFDQVVNGCEAIVSLIAHRPYKIRKDD